MTLEIDAIDTIIFDVGRVLFDISDEAFLNFFRAGGIEHPNPIEIYRTALGGLDFERGLITKKQFLTNVLNFMNLDSSHEERVVDLFNGMMIPVKDMLNLVKKLRLSYRVYLLSDTNEIHWTYMQHQYRIEDLADDVILSHKIGKIKSDTDTFSFVSKKYNIKPRKTVFIDDYEINIANAHNAGWHTIQHKDMKRTVSALSDLGVFV